jgi:hypothetical protein
MFIFTPITIPSSHCHELVIILVEGAAAVHLAVCKTVYRIYLNPKTQ